MKEKTSLEKCFYSHRKYTFSEKSSSLIRLVSQLSNISDTYMYPFSFSLFIIFTAWTILLSNENIMSSKRYDNFNMEINIKRFDFIYLKFDRLTGR